MLEQSNTISKVSIPKIFQRLNTTPEKLANFCQKWHIIELSLFGSVLREDFRPDGEDPSDIDLLYISEPNARYGFQFYEMQEELEQLFNRKVDLVSKQSIKNSRNQLRKNNILQSSQIIYVQRSTVHN